MTGLKNSFTLNGIKILRPLLCIDRNEIIAFLHDKKIRDYRLDTSNSDLHFRRNKIRKELIPILVKIGGGKKGIINSINYLEDDAKFLREIMVRKTNPMKKRIPIKALRELDESQWPLFIRTWIHENTGSNRPMRGSIIKNLQRRLINGPSHSARFETGTGFFLRVDRDHLVLEDKNPQSFDSTITWNWQIQQQLVLAEHHIELQAELRPSCEVGQFSDKNIEYWDPHSLGKMLTIRPRHRGDRMIPFGKIKTVRVKKLIGNAKLPVELKSKIIVLCNENGEILWIPLVRRANVGNVRAHCPNAVKLTCQFKEF